MNNQYELEFDDKKVEDYYYDQSPINSIVSSLYTSHGIKCIDSEYCTLIMNMDLKVKQVYAINRRTETLISKFNLKEYESSYKTFYDPIELNKGYGTIGVRVEWENGDTYDFNYGDRPLFDNKTNKTDPNQLISSIKENPHLHTKIKENLISNIK